MYQWLERTFHLSEKDTTIQKETIAGLSTFSTMAYILFVNPLILSKAGMDFSAVMCATIIASSIATLCMGLWANYPFALAPSMGLNTFFTYSIVLSLGHPWQVALGSCFIAGVVLLVLNILGLRQLLMNAIPPALRLSVAAGIGLFLAFVGLKDLGIIEPHPITYISVGSFFTYEVLFSLCTLLLIIAFMSYRVLGAILYSILIIWALGLATGMAKWNGLFSLPPNPLPTLLQLDIQGALHPDLFSVTLSFVFVTLFEATGVLVALAEQGGFLDSQGKLPRAKQALFSDAFGAIAGSCVGTSPLTTYLESASGIAAGGKTGLTSVIVVLLFLSTLFFGPLIQSIPVFATAPVLVIIGSMMLKSITRLNWDDPTEAIPAFVTLITIPFTFSIATGIAFGFILYPIAKLLGGKWREVHPITWLVAFFFIGKFAVGW